MALKLTELEPTWMRVDEPGKLHSYVDTLAEAQGVMFLCPVCFVANNGRVGTHMVLCWFRDRGVPDDEFPKPGRWAVNGTDFIDLTLTPSIFLTGEGCGWHGFITNGTVT